MRGYVPGEQPRSGSVVKLNTNENPYPPSPEVAPAVARAAEGDLRLYPSPCADELREKAAEVYHVRSDQVLVGNGSDDLLAICLRACVGEGDEVAFTVPTYFVYRSLVEIVGARRTEIADSARGCVPDGLVASSAPIKLVCTPGSPYGSVIELDQIRRLAAASAGMVVVDEAYGDFAEGSALALLSEHSNLVVVRSLSKSFSLAGVRLGLAFACPQVISELVKVKDSYNVSRLAIAAGVAALGDMAWMRANVARVVATRGRVVEALRERDWTVRDSDANFFWMDCGGAGGRSVYDRLYDLGVLVRWFDEPGLRSGVRVSVGSDAEMDRFLDALGSP